MGIVAISSTDPTSDCDLSSYVGRIQWEKQLFNRPRQVRDHNDDDDNDDGWNQSEYLFVPVFLSVE